MSGLKKRFYVTGGKRLADGDQLHALGRRTKPQPRPLDPRPDFGQPCFRVVIGHCRESLVSVDHLRLFC
jgi:hypothetical protein